VRRDSGFSLVELMVAMAIMMLISGAAVSALLKMTSAQTTIWNRTQMHSGIRGATEVLQQEVGQAGRIAFPNTVTLGGAISAGTATVTLNCSGSCASGTTAVSGMFVGEKLTIDSGCYDTSNPCNATSRIEVVALTAVDTSANQITAVFAKDHASGVPVQVFGGFSAGVVPSTTTSGSTATVLKLFGDINADGNMVYIEYTCDTTSGNLYRNSMAWNATAPSPAATQSQILLTNIVANPGGTACFTYQTQNVNGTDYITDVAITLTVQTQQVDPVTKQFQTETKALLNVSPRNVFNVWQLASLGINDRVQPTPPSVTSLLP